MAEDPRSNPKRAAMEDYSLRSDVHSLMFQFTTELFTSQPDDPLHFMVKWSNQQLKERELKGKAQQQT
eukprot:Gb_12491 [translate_table: standard]